MVWDDDYTIGDGLRTTDEDAVTVYRNYAECGIIMDKEKFDEINQHFVIYEESSSLGDIIITPETVPRQTTSDYYFMKLQVKIPRSHT